jgi:hypothetical protein
MSLVRRGTTGSVGVAVFALVIGLVGTTPPAAADGPGIPPGSTIILQSPTTVTIPPTTIYLTQSNTIVIDNPGQSVQVTPQCTDANGDAKMCVGSSDQMSTSKGGPSLDIRGLKEVLGPQLYGGLPRKSFDWIIAEGIASLKALHGVQGDSVISGYEKSKLRAYLVARIKLILDKKLYGQTLTAQEESTFTAFNDYWRVRELDRAKKVKAEYERWEANPCTYPVPPRPPVRGIPASPDNPVAKTAKCKKSFSPYVDASSFIQNTPPVSDFELWAAYREPSALLEALELPSAREMLLNLQVGLGYLGAIGAGVVVGFVTYLVATAVLSSAVAKSFLIATGGLGSFGAFSGATSASIIGAAAGAMAAIAAVFIITAAATGVSIWAILKEQSIAKTIRERVTTLESTTDPLGIVASQDDYAGLDFDSRQDPTNSEKKNLIHTTAFDKALTVAVAEWTMLDADGRFVPDAGYGTSSGAAVKAAVSPQAAAAGFTSGPSANDQRWRVNGQVRDNVAVLAPSGMVDGADQPISGAKVWFNDRWLMVSQFKNGAYQPARPQLSLPFVTTDGRNALMSVVMADDGGSGPVRPRFLVDVPASGNLAGLRFITDDWAFKGPGGVATTASIVEKIPVQPTFSLVPTALGALRPGGTVTFQANPSTPVSAVTDGVYSWTIEKIGENGQVLSTETVAGNLTGFQKVFADQGRYRARVTLVGTRLGAPVNASGSVEISVVTPVPELKSSSLGEARLVDDAILDGKLGLDLRMLENAPSDTFTVDVEWADDGQGSTIAERYTVQCVPVGDGTCETGALVSPASAPVNPQWSKSPTIVVPDDKPFLPYVTVKVTSARGATVTKVFRVPGDRRPRFVDPAPFVEMPAGTFSRIRVTEIVPSALLAAPPPGIPAITIVPYVTAINAQLPEGVQAEIVPEGGKYYLELFGQPSIEDVGPRGVDVPADQYPVGDTYRATPALMTLSVVSSADPGYRAVIRGGARLQQPNARTAWPAWYTQTPVRWPTLTGTPDPFAGTLMCKLVRFGNFAVLFDKPCANDAPFPWPAEVGDGDYQASVRAIGNNQPTITTPYTLSFLGRFLRPAVTVDPAAAGATTRTVRLDLLDGASDNAGSVIPAPFSSSGYTVTCAIDGAAPVPCLDNGTLAVPRIGTGRTVVVKVTAPDSAAVTRTVAFDQVAPGAPRGVKATSGNASAKVGWTAPASNGGAAITRYTVTARPGGRTCTTTGSLTCTVTGLANGTSYTFRVRATNAFGTGPSSTASAAVRPSTVPGKVRKVRAAFPRAKVTTISWVAPASTGGAALLRYEVRWKPANATTWKSWTSTKLQKSRTIKGLRKAKAYDVQVRAVNLRGGGQPVVLRIRPTR